jgi:ankyrin repeat protein
MSAAENNQMHFARWLIDNKANVNHPMTSGWTALHAAAKKKNYDMVKLLLEKGANKKITAVHRDLGRNLKAEDVTADARILRLLRDE